MEIPEVARANRDYLRGLYAVIKDREEHVHFTFVTGVSKFSKVSLFSGLNNLQDITLDPRYSAICGYTEKDLDTVFGAELRYNNNVYLFEFKVVESVPRGAAMAQLKEKRYADKYRTRGEPIWLIGVEFSRDERNIVEFAVEAA